MEISCAVDKKSGVSSITLLGDVDVQTTGELKEKLFECAEAAPRLVIDCGELDYIDSTGLGVLVAAYKKAKENGGGMRITNLKPFLNKLFVITALDRLIDIEVKKDE